MSAPGKLVRSSRWKTGPSKGQRPLSSECCVTAGDSGHEAYTAIAWGVRLSLERSDFAGPRVFICSKATCAAPLCEVLTPCRGQRPHHVQRDRIGTWEVSGLTGTARRRCRPASGRRGAVAGDARSREVGPRHSSWEAGEQSGTAPCGAICGGAKRSGAGGAKGGDQGECGPAKQAPDAAPGKPVTGTGTHTASRKGEKEGEVHRALPPHQYRTA